MTLGLLGDGIGRRHLPNGRRQPDVVSLVVTVPEDMARKELRLRPKPPMPSKVVLQAQH